jgi:hypothetical protein
VRPGINVVSESVDEGDRPIGSRATRFPPAAETPLLVSTLTGETLPVVDVALLLKAGFTGHRACTRSRISALADRSGEVHQSYSDFVMLGALLAARGSEISGLHVGDITAINGSSRSAARPLLAQAASSPSRPRGETSGTSRSCKRSPLRLSASPRAVSQRTDH